MRMRGHLYDETNAKGGAMQVAPPISDIYRKYVDAVRVVKFIWKHHGAASQGSDGLCVPRIRDSTSDVLAWPESPGFDLV